MLALTIRVEYHWGFWIRVPGTSKYQSTLPIPPPTTLIGALSYPLIKHEAVELNGSPIRGETLSIHENPTSPAMILEKYIVAASSYLENLAMVWEDLNKYNTVLFHETTKEKDEEKLAGGRRYLMKYRTGALPLGKVYYPNGGLTATFLIDANIRDIVKGNLERELEKAAWEITRIGSKESIVSVIDVQLTTAKPMNEKRVKTKYYFPAVLGNVGMGSSYYREMFWSGGWGRDAVSRFEEYLIPGSRTPVSSIPIVVELTPRANAFRVNGEILITGEH